MGLRSDKAWHHQNHPQDFVQYEMNEHDRQLVEAARKLDYTDWMMADESKAETIEGYEELHHISVRLYHMEEASCGML